MTTDEALAGAQPKLSSLFTWKEISGNAAIQIHLELMITAFYKTKTTTQTVIQIVSLLQLPVYMFVTIIVNKSITIKSLVVLCMYK